MLLLPLDRPIDWRNPPMVTLLLVLMNVIIFFTWQGSDSQNIKHAYDYYQSSGLMQIELEKHLELTHQLNKLAQLKKTGLKKSHDPDVEDMFRDKAFQFKLAHDQIFSPQDSLHAEWKQKRQRFAELNQQVVSQRYGLVPDNPSVLTFFTSMFLHGGFDHLLGNMIVLLLIGYVVETILGYGIYAMGYMLAGLAGNALFVLLERESVMPGIGASGAIYGILGMYLVLFALRKIRFFLFIFVYFHYFRAPALIMLIPLAGWELYNQVYASSSTNFLAHLGGLAGGALVAFAARRFLSKDSRDYMDADIKKEKYLREFAQAQQHLATMNIKAAKSGFESLLADYPDDILIKNQLFNIAKLSPDSPEFHQLAAQLLNLNGADHHTVKIVHDVFVDYSKLARPKPQWNAELLLRLATRFAANNYLDDAEKIMKFLMQAKPQQQQNAQGLSALVKYFNGKDKNKVEQYKQLLLQHYPNSVEAQHLR